MFVANAVKRTHQTALEKAEYIFNVIRRVLTLAVSPAVIDRRMLVRKVFLERKRNVSTTLRHMTAEFSEFFLVSGMVC
jgi:hypothetical protein